MVVFVCLKKYTILFHSSFLNINMEYVHTWIGVIEVTPQYLMHEHVHTFLRNNFVKLVADIEHEVGWDQRKH